MRFGVATSALFATVTTDASCGAVNSMHDSFTPLGGLVPLANIQLGEVIFGGVGRGALRDARLRGADGVHRRPHGRAHARVPGQEDRGARDEAGDAVRAHLPAADPGFAAWAAVEPVRRVVAEQRAVRTGSSEILYAYTSGAGNNGSAFAGLNANTPWYNVSLGLAMLAGRFLMIVPALGIAGSMVGKKVGPAGPGHLPHRRLAVRRAAGRPWS